MSEQQVIMGLSWAIRQSLLSTVRLHDGRTIIPLYTCVQMGIISMGQGSPIYWLLLNSHCTRFIKYWELFKHIQANKRGWKCLKSDLVSLIESA